MACSITDEQRKDFEAYLKQNPIDPQYDAFADMLDVDDIVPLEQQLSRLMQELLNRADAKE